MGWTAVVPHDMVPYDIECANEQSTLCGAFHCGRRSVLFRCGCTFNKYRAYCRNFCFVGHHSRRIHVSLCQCTLYACTCSNLGTSLFRARQCHCFPPAWLPSHLSVKSTTYLVCMSENKTNC